MRLFYILLLSFNFYNVLGTICLRNQHVSGGACVTCTFPDVRPAGDDTANGDTTCTSVTVSALPDCGITLPATGQTSQITLTQDCKSGELIFGSGNSGTLIINGGGYSIVASGTGHRFIRNYDEAIDGTVASEAHIKLNNVNIDGFQGGTDNYGGAFKTENTWLEAKSCSFTRNHAAWRGGVIRAESDSLTYFEDCEFAGNRIGSNSGSTARGGIVSAATTSTSSARLIIRSSKIADTKRDSGQNDFVDCKDTNHCVLDSITADVAFAQQNIDLKTNMACPASGVNFDVGSKFSSDVNTDYNFCKAGSTCATEVADYTIACSSGPALLPCAQNEKVVSNACVACGAGYSNTAGDDPTGADTTCDATICGANLRVVNNDCVSCPAGTTNDAGDDASGADTTCACASNEFLNGNNQCEACAIGTGGDGTACNTCVANYRVHTSFQSDNTKKYEGQSCSSVSDCENKCASDGSCNGYSSETQPGTWEDRKQSTKWKAIATSGDGTKLVAGEFNGNIWTSTDSGASWTSRASSQSWVSITSSKDGTKLAATTGSGIWTSSDSGETWTVTSAGNKNWQGIDSSEDGTTIVAAARSLTGEKIYISTNSGSTWNVAGDSETQKWVDVAVSADGTKMAAIHKTVDNYGGKIWLSTNSGATWVADNKNAGGYDITFTYKSLARVSMSADGTKIAVAVNSDQIYVSTDSGGSWAAKASTQYWWGLAMSADGTKMAASVYTGKVWVSTDGGDTWNEESSLTSGKYDDIVLSEDGSMLAVVQVDGGNIYTTQSTVSYAYGPIVAGTSTSFTKDKGCQLCPTGTSNDAGDDSSGADTNCDPILCGANLRVVNNDCVSCPPGTSNDAGDDASGADTTCDPISCGANEHVVSNVCTPCPDTSTKPAGDDASGADTVCACPADQFLNATSQCDTCATGTGGDGSACDKCAENYHVSSNQCVACPDGTRPAGDDKNGADTVCVCPTDKIMNATNQCDACPIGSGGDGSACDKCGTNYHVTQPGFLADSAKKYEGTDCAGSADCETKCYANATCAGYTIGFQGDLLGSGQHTFCATLSGGTKCWGFGSYQMHGYGDTNNRGDEASEMGSNLAYVAFDHNVVEMGSGSNSGFMCALLSNGDVECWGYSSYNALNGANSLTFANRNTVVSGAKAMSASSNHACALMETGNLKCWGMDNRGQLGDGVSPASAWSSRTITDVSNINNAIDVAVGNDHSCALLDTGKVMCWGQSYKVGVQFDQMSPVEVPDVDGAIQIDAGYMATCALLNTGKIMCWGSSSNAYFGDNLASPSGHLSKHTVSDIGDTLPNAVKVSLGRDHACAVLVNGDLYCWGSNTYGQVGDGTTTQRNTPVKILSNVKDVEAGGRWATCTILQDDSVKCWGRGSNGQLGQGDTTDHSSPVSVDLADTFPSTAITYGQLVAGSGDSYSKQDKVCTACPHTSMRPSGDDPAAGVTECSCAVNNFLNETSHCEACADGYLGDGTVCDKCATDYHMSVAYPPNSNKYDGASCADDGICNGLCSLDSNCAGYTLGDWKIAWAEYNTMAAVGAGVVYNWGKGTYQAWVDGTQNTAMGTPTKIPGITNAVDVAISMNSGCALLSDKTVSCWGKNKYTGNGGTDTTIKPPTIVAGLTDVVALKGRGQTYCALLADKNLKCWGGAGTGEMGVGNSNHQPIPILAFGSNGDIEDFDIGYGHGCVIYTGGALKCAGYNYYGQVGMGNSGASYNSFNSPTQVKKYGGGDATDAVSIYCGYQHSCYVSTDDKLRCWGNGGYAVGWAGNDPTTIATPISSSMDNPTWVTLGRNGGCAGISNGDIYCWGGNSGYDTGDSYPKLTTFSGMVQQGGNSNVFVSEGGQVRSAGTGSAGELGHGETVTRYGWNNNKLVLLPNAGGSYGPLVNGTGNSKQKGAITCTACPSGTTLSVKGEPGLGVGSFCTRDTGCDQNEYVKVDHTCETCPTGTFNDLGDTTVGQCDDVYKCLVNEHVKTTFDSDSEKNYAGSACTSTGDCVTKCHGDAACAGYTEGEFTIDMAYHYGGMCVLSSSGKARCLGEAAGYRLGNQNQGSTATLTFVDVDNIDGSSDDKFAIAIAGAYHAHLALMRDGSVMSWGCYSGTGLGGSCYWPDYLKKDSVKITNAIKIAHIYHGCAILDTGEMLCWGSNYRGEVDTNRGSVKSTPVTAGGTSSWKMDGSTDERSVVDVALGDYLTCALMKDGKLRCWGNNGYGQTGQGTVNPSPYNYETSPSNNEATGIDGQTPASTVVKMKNGKEHMCVLMGDGSLKCWGRGTYGQFCNEDLADQHSPVTVFAGESIKDFTTGKVETCILTTVGELKCCGKGRIVGGGTDAPITTTPATIAGISNGIAIYSDPMDSIGKMCVLMEDRSMKCWGQNYQGGLGIGSSSPSYNPVSNSDVLNLQTYSANYGALVAGSGNSYTKNIACQACGAGYTNAPMDEVTLQVDTPCDFTPCLENFAVKSGACTACATGATRVGGDADPLVDTYCICDENQYVSSGFCTACATGTNPAGDVGPANTYCNCGVNERVTSGACVACTSGANRAAGDDLGAGDTYCTCGVNQHIVSNVCTECPSGSTRAAGDDASGADTVCLIAPCAKDYRVKDNVCVPCPIGMTNDAGDTNANGDTYCDSTFVCGEDQYVSNHLCVNCPATKTAPYGSNPAGADTECNWIVCKRDEYSNGASCQPCATGTYNNPGDTTETVTTCNDAQICKENHQLSFKYTLQSNYQISNGAGYLAENAITDFDYAKKLCDLDSSCNGLTKDSSNNYYLSDGTASSNSAYDAYNINRATYDCLACRGSGTHAAGEDPNTATGITNCTYADCPANYGSSDGSCVACTGGKVRNPPINPEQDHKCTIVPCAADERVVKDFKTTPVKFFGGNVCTSAADCEVKCADDSSCEGYSALSVMDFVAPNVKYAGNSCSNFDNCLTKCNAASSCQGFSRGVSTGLSYGHYDPYTSAGDCQSLRGSNVNWMGGGNSNAAPGCIHISGYGISTPYNLWNGDHTPNPTYTSQRNINGVYWTPMGANGAWSYGTATTGAVDFSIGYMPVKYSYGTETTASGIAPSWTSKTNVNAGYKCFACVAPSTNEAGDTDLNGETLCDWGLCGQDQRASNKACVACDAGTFNFAGDPANTDSTCDDPDTCEDNEYSHLARLTEEKIGSHYLGSVYGFAMSRDGTKVVSTTWSGQPKISSNGGVSYSSLSFSHFSSNNQWIGAAMSADGSVVAMVFRDYTIQVSRNGGLTSADWQSPHGGYASGGWKPYWDVDMSADGSIIIAGVLGQTEITISTDTGNTWSQITNAGFGGTGSKRHAAAKHNGNMVIVVAGENGKVMRSTDASTWTESTVSNPAGLAVSELDDWKSATISDDGRYVVLANKKYLYVSSDFGVTFTQDTSIGSAQNYFRRVKSSADGKHVYATLSTDLMFSSDNYGATWTNLGSGRGDTREFMQLTSDGTLYTAYSYLRKGIPAYGCSACPSSGTRTGTRIATEPFGCNYGICNANERVVNYACVACDPGTFNDAGDDAGGGNTICDDVETCPANHYAVGSTCTPCEHGGTNAGGKVDSGLVCVYPDCQTDQYSTGNGQCLTCPVGRFMPTPINPSTAAQCTCLANERVQSNACVACLSGFTNAAGDDPNGADTQCDFTPCDLNHYVAGTGDSRVCTACTGGTFSAGGLVTECSGTEYCAVNQKVVSTACVNCPTGQQNALGVATDKSGPDGTCAAAPCVANQYSDGSICQNCPQHTGANSAGLDPTAGVTTCVPTTCGTDQYVESNVCKLCDSKAYRLAGDQVFGGDTHCFCKDHHKVINKACVACEVGSSNPNLCYSGLQNHYCVCDANYHVVSNLCTACPGSATRPVGDYAGNADTHCICGEDQHVVSNACVACPAGTKRPAGDDSSGADTPCSCQENEHVKNVTNVLQCTACPTGSLRAAGDLVANGETVCACPENFHVSSGQCVACVAGTRAAGDDPLAGDTHCACNENHHVASNVCTACPSDSTRAAGDDAGGDDTKCACNENFKVSTGSCSACPANTEVAAGGDLGGVDTVCTCKENFYSNGDGSCSACGSGAIIPAGSDPAVASVCTCDAGYELNGASCSACGSNEESVAGGACLCKENHHVSGGACTACAPGSTHPAGDDKTADTVCTNTLCAENERVQNNVCVPCVTGMVRAAGDDATGANTVCAYQGTEHEITAVGAYAFRIDTLANNAPLTIRVGETHTFIRGTSGDPFRIVTAEDCAGKGCDLGQYTELPTSSLGLDDAEKDVAVTVFAPTLGGTYYYMSTTTPFRKGRIYVKYPFCTITYPVTTLTQSCELSGEETLTGDLTITYSLARLRAQEGDVPQITAADGARHFTVSGGHKFTIENIDLSGGRGAEGGSILVDNGEIDANNVKFTDNVASSQGGAIRVKNAASKVNLNNILFDGNQGTEGGALSLDTLTQKAEIHNSDFKNNRASTGHGGAIRADAELNITITNFEDNAANVGEGGAISSTKDVTMAGSSFKRNRALKGGAMRAFNNKVDMSNMVIEANEAVEEGGAFDAENSEFDVKSSSIIGNKAKRGAAFKTKSTGCTTDCKKLRIQSSSLEDNEATTDGGAVDFDADANAEPQFWIQDSTMKNNKAGGQPSDFKKRGANVKIKAIDSDIGAIDGGAVDSTCEAGQCDGRAHSTCASGTVGSKCECDGTSRHLDGVECKEHKVCTGLDLDVEIRGPDKTHNRLCGTKDIAEITHKLDAKGKELANMIEAKLVSEGVAADQAYALAVEVFGEVNKCE